MKFIAACDIDCAFCGKPFRPTRSRNKYCSKVCRLTAGNIKREFYNKSLSTTTIGTIGELRVCADLLTRGYDVFLAVSQACPCDLVAIKNSIIMRVEVRTGYEADSGKICVAKMKGHEGRYDLFVTVLPDRIIYDPEIE